MSVTTKSTSAVRVGIFMNKELMAAAREAVIQNAQTTV